MDMWVQGLRGSKSFTYEGASCRGSWCGGVCGVYSESIASWYGWGCHVLRTCLLLLKAPDNEELVRLQVDTDTGNLHLLDMLLDLELFLCLAIDRWTACVTH
jgi:hypothetical protein